MYEPLDLQYYADEIATLVRIAESLDLTKGAASYITDPVETLREYQFHAPWFAHSLTTTVAEKIAAMKIVVLQPGQQIPLHHDAAIPGSRYHVPVKMNVDCWVFHGDWQQLYPGRVYRMDPTQGHGAVNWGLTVRLHLVVDTEG